MAGGGGLTGWRSNTEHAKGQSAIAIFHDVTVRKKHALFTALNYEKNTTLHDSSSMRIAG